MVESVEPFGSIDGFVRNARIADLALWLEQLPRGEALQHLLSLALSRRAEVFEYLPLAVQVELAREMDHRVLTELTTEMDADDRTDLFKCLTVKEQQNLLDSLAPAEREDIHRLAAFREGTAGAIMTSDYATLPEDLTAVEAIASLRRESPGKETIYRSYIVDRQGRLIGSLRLHDLILADDDTPVARLMERTPISVDADTSQEDAAQLIERYDVLALPVLDGDGRLLGIITHDDASDAMQRAVTEDFQKIATVRPLSESFREAGIGVLYKKRVFWLTLLVFGNLFSGASIAHFEDTILAYVSLVFFLPLLIDSSGNAGSQSATLMVRALATGDVTLADWRDLIARELLIGLALGVTMAAVVYPLGLFRGGSDVALVVALTMLFVVLAGCLVGMSLPFVLSWLRFDPATASTPLVTTISDATGVLVYFSIASLVLAS